MCPVSNQTSDSQPKTETCHHPSVFYRWVYTKSSRFFNFLYVAWFSAIWMAFCCEFSDSENACIRIALCSSIVAVLGCAIEIVLYHFIDIFFCIFISFWYRFFKTTQTSFSLLIYIPTGYSNLGSDFSWRLMHPPPPGGSSPPIGWGRLFGLLGSPYLIDLLFMSVVL